ncbi:Aminomethyltransferase, mitochondrial [Marasmius tenuissimus]|uniref:Aminomethyltransferase n=1 Tax=Marasmius tenuissimus TaxID=585030 RepID=A0ABR2ZQV1_9AGAR
MIFLRLARQRVRGYATQSTASLSRTGLYDFHLKNGAKMVPFAGFEMPLSYGDVGQVQTDELKLSVASHNHVRSSAGLFDVGHMVQSHFRGATATKFLEWVTPSSISALKPYQSTLSVLLNEKGGIIDDTVVTKHAEDAFYVVTNAGRRDRDLQWFKEKLDEWNSSDGQGKGANVEMEVLEGWGLLALQGPYFVWLAGTANTQMLKTGPEAASYLQTLTPFDLKTLPFGTSAWVPIEGFNLHVARGGYTGEDGFEISIPPANTVEVAELLTKDPKVVQLTGLGARDSLRLEAGMCLYGNDLDETTSPVEAGLTWVIGKNRRESGTFIGAEGVQKHLKEGPPRRRVGFIVEGAPARQGAKIFSADAQIGTITSGIPSPTLAKNIAMGYVQSGQHKKGTELEVEVRGKRRKAVVEGMPFVKPRYYRG